VIATAEFHPSSCSLLAYGSSGGLVRLVDLRRSALCDQSARTFRDRGSRPQPSTFFTEIISCITDLKFTGKGRYLLTRDYMNLKLWDMRVETSPVATYKVHEFLRPKKCCLSAGAAAVRIVRRGLHLRPVQLLRQQGWELLRHWILQVFTTETHGQSVLISSPILGHFLIVSDCYDKQQHVQSFHPYCFTDHWYYVRS